MPDRSQKDDFVTIMIFSGYGKRIPAGGRSAVSASVNYNFRNKSTLKTEKNLNFASFAKNTERAHTESASQIAQRDDPAPSRPIGSKKVERISPLHFRNYKRTTDALKE